MPSLHLPIVGGRFRPPAELVMSALSLGTPLFLSAEPDNAYDPNAIAVWILSEDIPPSAHSKLETELPRFGLDLDSLLATDQWHLGYIPRERAADLTEAGFPKSVIVQATFTLTSVGKPAVDFDWPQAEAAG